MYSNQDTKTIQMTLLVISKDEKHKQNHLHKQANLTMNKQRIYHSNVSAPHLHVYGGPLDIQ